MSARQNEARNASNGRVAYKILPLSCELPVPSVPSGVTFTKEERAMYRSIFKGPHGNFLDESNAYEVATYVLLSHQLFRGDASAWVAAERGKLATQLGMTPVSLKALGYVLEGSQ